MDSDAKELGHVRVASSKGGLGLLSAVCDPTFHSTSRSPVPGVSFSFDGEGDFGPGFVCPADNLGECSGFRDRRLIPDKSPIGVPVESESPYRTWPRTCLLILMNGGLSIVPGRAVQPVEEMRLLL
jgi:hypothetical protein